MAGQVADLQRRKLRRLMTLVAIFAYGPSALLITIGVLILVFGHATKDVVFGIMTLSLTVTLLGGVALTIVYVRRESSVAQLQTEFVNKVSHDLRTPLTSIRLFVETLQGGRLRDPEKIKDRNHQHQSRVLDQRDEFVGHRGEGDPQSLRQDDELRRAPIAKAERGRRLLLPLRQSLQAATHRFRHIGRDNEAEPDDRAREPIHPDAEIGRAHV